MIHTIRHVWPVILLSLIISAVYIGAANTGDGLAAPVDDAYIHFQYASQASKGMIWQYNSTDAPSSGATSFIYPFIIAIGYMLNLTDGYVVGSAIFFGALCFIATTVLIYFATAHLIRIVTPTADSDRWGKYISVLFLLTGAIQFNFFNGMETGLFAIFLLAALLALLNKYQILCAFLLITSSLVRPEGVFLTAIYLSAFALTSFISSGDKKDAFLAGAKMILMSVICLIPYGVNYLITGSIVASGASAKSWLGHVPFRPYDMTISMINEFVIILSRMSIASFAQRPWWVPLGLLPLAIICCVALWKKQQRLLVLTLVGSVGIGVALSATLMTATWHVGRYQIPYLVMMFPIAGVGLFMVYDYFRKFSSPLAICFLISFFGYAAFGTVQNVYDYRQAIMSTADQQIAIGRWINENLDDSAFVAITDAGAIRFFGNRTMLDMIGLTTQGYAGVWREGVGAVFEKMELLDAPPTHIATYPNVLSATYFNGTDLFAEELFRADVPNWSSIGSAAGLQSVYKIDWSKANVGNNLQQADTVSVVDGQNLLGRIDVADVDSEAMHNLTWWEGETPIGFPTIVNQFGHLAPAESAVLDGGRMLTGGIEFSVESASKRPILLAARIHNPQSGRFVVFANGEAVGEWSFVPAAGYWLESYFVVDADFVNEGTNTISLTLAGPATHIELYHLWAYDYASPIEPVQPSVVTDIHFADSINLLGYSLNETHENQVSKGGALELDLLWSPIGDINTDAKVFVHVYSEEGDLVTQSDGYPAYGTRPPYTWNWNSDEVILDKRVIWFGEDIESGTYQVAIGLYDPVSGMRLAVDEQTECNLDGSRACLMTIEVVD